MQTLLLDEYAEAEKALSGTSNLKPAEQVFLLARYNKHVLSMSNKDSANFLREYVSGRFPGGDGPAWSGLIEKSIKYAKDRPLAALPGVDITESEMRCVESLKPRGEQRLLFTLITLAKYNNLRRGSSQSWVNCRLGDILRLAGGNITHKDGYGILHTFLEKGFIRLREGIGDLALQVLCVDYESETAFTLRDMRAIGFEYLSFAGHGKFVRCKSCGLLVRQSQKGNRKYCDNCRAQPANSERRVLCEDCGKVFWVENSVRNKSRCDCCQEKFRREYKRRHMEDRRTCGLF